MLHWSTQTLKSGQLKAISKSHPQSNARDSIRRLRSPCVLHVSTLTWKQQLTPHHQGGSYVTLVSFSFAKRDILAHVHQNLVLIIGDHNSSRTPFFGSLTLSFLLSCRVFSHSSDAIPPSRKTRRWTGKVCASEFSVSRQSGRPAARPREDQNRQPATRHMYQEKRAPPLSTFDVSSFVTTIGSLRE